MSIYNTGSDLLYIIKGNSDFYKSLNYGDSESKRVNFYDYRLSGSYSIKKTLPVFSDLSYSNLDVKNGTEALVTYASFKTMPFLSISKISTLSPTFNFLGSL